MRKQIILLLLAVVCGVGQIHAERRVSFGLRGGLLSRSYTLDQESLVFTDAKGDEAHKYANFTSESKYGFEAGLMLRVRLWKSANEATGASVHLQLDGIYGQNNLILYAKNEGDDVNVLSSKITTRTIDVPLMVCLKASVVRLSAGAVFHAYNKYDVRSGNIGFEGLMPLCGYALGIGFDFGKVTLDGRYCGEIKKGSWNIINNAYSSKLTGRRASWSVCLGVAF